MTDCVDVLYILQTVDIEVLKEMEKALEEIKTLERLSLSVAMKTILPKEFCRHVLIGTRRIASLSELDFHFLPESWDCPSDGRLMCVRHMLCDSVGCSV